MKNKENDFDNLSRIYDQLGWLVFGSTLRKAQRSFTGDIPSGSKVLILGGGTGKFLTDLLNTCPSARIWYIDASGKMIASARRKSKSFQQADLTFIHGTEENIPPGITFDVIITNFFLDLFPERILSEKVNKLIDTLSPGGSWLVTDFVSTGKWRHTLLLKIMYRFFKLTCSISANELPDWRGVLSQTVLRKIKSRPFQGDFIQSIVFQRNG